MTVSQSSKLPKWQAGRDFCQNGSLCKSCAEKVWHDFCPSKRRAETIEKSEKLCQIFFTEKSWDFACKLNSDL